MNCQEPQSLTAVPSPPFPGADFPPRPLCPPGILPPPVYALKAMMEQGCSRTIRKWFVQMFVRLIRLNNRLTKAFSIETPVFVPPWPLRKHGISVQTRGPVHTGARRADESNNCLWRLARFNLRVRGSQTKLSHFKPVLFSEIQRMFSCPPPRALTAFYPSGIWRSLIAGI